jgi:hypothetical protein
MAVEVNGTSNKFEVGIPKPLFELRIGTIFFPSYDVTADGQRFLVNTLIEQNAPSPLTVVMNWTAGMKR